MKGNEISGLLKVKGIKIVDIAKELNLNKSTITNVIYGRTKSKRIQSAISKYLGMKTDNLWSTLKQQGGETK